MNAVAFKQLLDKFCAEEAETLKELLVRNDAKPWDATGDAAFVAYMHTKFEQLAQHFMRRAYLFGSYRVNGNREENLPKLPVDLKYGDLYKAWETIVLDAHN